MARISCHFSSRPTTSSPSAQSGTAVTARRRRVATRPGIPTVRSSTPTRGQVAGRRATTQEPATRLIPLTRFFLEEKSCAVAEMVGSTNYELFQEACGVSGDLAGGWRRSLVQQELQPSPAVGHLARDMGGCMPVEDFYHGGQTASAKTPRAGSAIVEPRSTVARMRFLLVPPRKCEGAVANHAK